jgi:molybdopterin/thiamine biosynthesis adenylyltransferase
VGVFAAGLTRGRPLDQRQPCYRCLTPDIPPDAETCSVVGVVGALAGVIGSMMALEAVKMITGAGQSLMGRLLLYDGLEGDSRVVRIGPDPECPACGASACGRPWSPCLGIS